jgi:uncharacterized protein
MLVSKAVIKTYDASEDIRKIVIRVALILALMALYITISAVASNGLEVTHTNITVNDLPQALDGLRIIQISDLHSSRFGKDQSELIDKISAEKPDIIVITGDFIDGVNPDSAPCEELVRGLVSIAPVYRVRGNHEYYLDSQMQVSFDEDMAACGAMLLDNSTVILTKNGTPYLLGGMNDVYKHQFDIADDIINRDQFYMDIAKGYMTDLAKSMPLGDYPLKIMLCHQPQYWQLWRGAGYDIALCGHLHGWIARMPGIGGILRMPNVYFPEEDAGYYNKQGIQVYISRGLDSLKSWRNIRLNNKPELTVIEVRKLPH